MRDGVPYLFHEHWLDEIYTLQAQQKVIMKAAQVRISEYLLSETFWRMTAHGWNVFYAFPTTKKCNEFVKGRVKGAVSSSPYLHGLLGTDDVGIMSLGSRFVYFSGAQKQDQVTSASVDMVVRDEYDFFPYDVLPAIEKRYGDSVHQYLRDVSHPRFPEVGIDKRHKESDQRLWHVCCPAPKCGHEQPLTWEAVKFSAETADLCRQKNIVKPGKIKIACQRCGAALDRGAVGRWIPQQPGVGLVGYHISKLMNPRADLAELVHNSLQETEYERQAFYNYDLGQAYSPKGSQVTREMLDKCLRQGYHLPSGAQGGTFMGIDVGSRLHYWVEADNEDGTNPPVAFGAVQTFEQLDRIVAHFRPNVALIDANPETRKAREWVRQAKCAAAVTYFATKSKHAQLLHSFDEANRVATINRTFACDCVERDFSEQRTYLPAHANEDPELYAHLMAPKRVIEKDTNTGEMTVRWINTSADHLYFAKLYAAGARELYYKLGFGRHQMVDLTEENSGIVEGTERTTLEDL